MHLNFEPVTNRIGDDYFIVPKNDDTGHKVIIRCNEETAFIINLLVVNHNREEMIAATAAQYPDATIEEVTECVDAIRDELLKHATIPEPEPDTETEEGAE